MGISGLRAIFAVAQLAVFLVLFMRFNGGPDKINCSPPPAFGAMLVAIAIFGSQWTTHPLNHTMALVISLTPDVTDRSTTSDLSTVLASVKSLASVGTPRAKDGPCRRRVDRNNLHELPAVIWASRCAELLTRLAERGLRWPMGHRYSCL